MVRFLICSLQPCDHAGSSFADLSSLKMEAIRSSETSVHIRYTRHHITEDSILQDYRKQILIGIVEATELGLYKTDVGDTLFVFSNRFVT
jgi:hypothetical protein